MRDLIHVTSLTKVMECAWAFANEKTDFIDPAVTYPWDMLNIAVLSKWTPQPFLDQYIKTLNGDFKFAALAKPVFEDAKKYITDINATHDFVYQEAKMVLKFNEDYWIVGSPDLHFFDEKEWIWYVEDFKFGKHSWYGRKEIFEYDAQPYVYSRMLMEYYWVDKVKFRFRVYDKWNGQLKLFSHPAEEYITKAMADDYIARAMDIYIEWKEIGIWKSPKCYNFGHMKTWCPAHQHKVSEINL